MENKSTLLLIICPPFWEKLPPLGLAYLAEYLEYNRFKVIIYDLNILTFNLINKEFKKDWTINKNYLKEEFFVYCFTNFNSIFKELLDIIKINKIEYIGFSVFKNNKIFSIKTAQFIKQNIKNIKIIFGGPEIFSLSVTNRLNEIENIDYFVVGEGELPLINILNNSSDKIVKFLELSDINFYPKYRNFNLKLYSRPNSLPIIATRGCINKCTFCSEKFLYKKYRFRQPENIFEEIFYHNKKNINWFTFYDSMFNSNLTQIETLMDLIIQKGVKIIWDAQIYIRNDMDITLLQKMKQAGCINLFIGLESGSDKILKLMNKKFNTSDAIEFFYKLKKANLHFEISLIINYPQETEEELNETINFLIKNKELIPKIAQINTLKEYPGTNLKVDKEKEEEKLNRVLTILREHKIKFTNSYINNLI